MYKETCHMAIQKVKSEGCAKSETTKAVATMPMVTATITTLHEDKPLVVQVPAGATVEAALKQAGVDVNPGWEVYVDGKLASLTTPLQANTELFYVVRVAGGRN
jgi:hypothetical protein